MRVVFLYASLLALLFVALSVRTLLLRRRLRIGIALSPPPRTQAQRHQRPRRRASGPASPWAWLGRAA